MQQSWLIPFQKLERLFGSAKFAVIIILVFAACLTYGTFMESYHGAEYANRLVYKSWAFMGLQGLMFLSILTATLHRFPIRPHLRGFHTVHLGLMVLFLGSFITYQGGVDGNIVLAPNTPVRQVALNSDQLSLQFPAQRKEVTIDLPYGAGPRDLDLDYQGVKLGTFLPFADEETVWRHDPSADPARMHSSEYRLQNPNFGETLILSLHPGADFPSTTQLGPLSVHYMPEGLASCFGANAPEGLLLWNAATGGCLALASKDLKQRKLPGGVMVEIQTPEGLQRFMPATSPLPMDEKNQMRENSPYRIFSRKLFEAKPHLFLFGKAVAFFDKTEKKWHSVSFQDHQAVALPWMGFEVTLLRHEPSSYPVKTPVAVTPIQDNGQLIHGGLKAVEVHVDGSSFWVTSAQAMSFERPSGKVVFELGKKSLTLPFEITLDRFKMDTDPGTASPASYESFISLFKGNQGTEKHHVYMNHPLKHDAFTFYQASYYQTPQGPYGSVFSVNYDPGRPWKYLGALLLVGGTIWHFIIRGRKNHV